jgi:hypothetical protein
VWRDPPPGADRTFVRIDGPLSLESWMNGIRAGRTFATTGPILLLDVDGREPGDEIALGSAASMTVPVRVELRSITPVDSVEILVNGRVAAAMAPDDPMRFVFEADVPIPKGGWIAARARGPSSRYVTDSYAFAQTSPVWVVRDGRHWTSADDARFLADAVRAVWARVRDADWSTPGERERFETAVNEAIAVYEGIAAR